MAAFKRYLFASSVVLVLLNYVSYIEANMRFVPDDPDLFSNCEDHPGTNGMNDLADISETVIDLDDDVITISGDATIVWDVDPDERIEMRIDLFKFQGGKWQPTIISLTTNDFCKSMLDENDVFFKKWTTYVKPEDRACLSKGHVYHHKKFETKVEVDADNVNISGRHKVQVQMIAYDKHNEPTGKKICYGIIGEIEKM